MQAAGELLGLALGAVVHEDLVTPVADALLRARLGVQLQVDHGQVTVLLEEHLAEAEGVLGAVGAGVGGAQADHLRSVLDVDVDAVLAERSLAVLEGRVRRQGDRRDVGVPRDVDLLEVSRVRDVAVVADRPLGGLEHLVPVGSTDVDLATVTVAHERLEVVILALGRPAVADHDGRVTGGRLGQGDPGTLGQVDPTGGRSSLLHGCLRSRALLVEQSHGESFLKILVADPNPFGDGIKR